MIAARRGLLACGASALALALAPGPAAPQQAAGAEAVSAGSGPSRMLVTATEFRYTLSRVRLPAGPALIEMYNRGEDPHNLRIKRRGRKRVWRIGRTAPGATGERRLRLRRGARYILWCSLPAHRERGMSAKLRARRSG